jgi:oligopeptide transport system substrate-binding protein
MCKTPLVFLLILMALFGCHCSKKPTIEKKILRINLGDEPQSLDPRRVRDPNAMTLLRMCFEGLTRIGPDDTPQLALASTCSISEDLKTYRFTLRPALWSNGSSVKASDFEYAWKRALSPTFCSDQSFLLYLIKGGKQAKEDLIPLEEVAIYAEDEKTLVIELESPVPYFLELLAAPIFYPVCEEVDRRNPRWAEKAETFVCNGPFLLKAWRHHDRISVEKNPTYWDKNSVHLDGIDLAMVCSDTEMKLFEKRDLHWAGSPLSTLPLDALNGLKQEGKITPFPIAETSFIRANTEHPLLSHPKVRKALCFAIDRKAIVDHVTQGGQVPVTSLIPPSLMGKSGGYFQDADVENAAKLFKEALAELNIQEPKLTLSYIASERSYLIAQALQQQWYQALGIHITLEGIERKVYFSRLSKQDYQLAFCSWRADFHDPINFLEVFKYKTKGSNNTHWENPDYIQLLDASFTEGNSQKRLKMLQRSEEILMEAMPIFPVFQYSMLYLKDEHLRGVFLSSLGNLDFKWAILENPN